MAHRNMLLTFQISRRNMWHTAGSLPQRFGFKHTLTLVGP